jgi:addiction module HigA family antidote
MATTKQIRRPQRPGEILRDRYLVPNNMSAAQFAEACGVTDKHMQAIVSGRAPRLTAHMALRLATALGTTAEYWLNLQRAVELYDARTRIAASGKRPLPMAIAGARAR